MKKVLLLTSLLLFVFSASSFAQILLPQDKKVLKEEQTELEEQNPIEESDYDCDQIEYQIVKKGNQYEVVLNAKGQKPHHWDLVKVLEEGSTDSVQILTTRRNSIVTNETGEYLLAAMSADDEVLCATEISINESNARGFWSIFTRKKCKAHQHPNNLKLWTTTSHNEYHHKLIIEYKGKLDYRKMEWSVFNGRKWSRISMQQRKKTLPVAPGVYLVLYKYKCGGSTYKGLNSIYIKNRLYPCGGGVRVRANGQGTNGRQLMTGGRPYCDVQVVEWKNKKRRVNKVTIDGRTVGNSNSRRVYKRVYAPVNICIYYTCEGKNSRSCGSITIGRDNNPRYMKTPK